MIVTVLCVLICGWHPRMTVAIAYYKQNTNISTEICRSEAAHSLKRQSKVRS